VLVYNIAYTKVAVYFWNHSKFYLADSLWCNKKPLKINNFLWVTQDDNQKSDESKDHSVVDKSSL